MNIARLTRRGIAVAALLILAACAAKPVPFDKAAAPQMKTIGIVTPYYPDGASIILATSVGQSFGLIGAMIDAGIRSNQEGRFRKNVAAENLAVPDDFMAALNAALPASGYTFVPVEAKRDAADFLKGGYPTDKEPKVDAYLDIVTLGYGYVAAGIQSSAPFRPFYSLKVQLVSAKDNTLLLQDSNVFNPVGPTQGTGIVAVTIPPEPQPSYPNFGDLEADPKGSVTGLKTAVAKSAEAVARLLR